eukprot:1628112-Rhodomonas_salina.1
MAQADSQGDNAESFKGLTQKLYIVPQANVLTGDGQKIETSNGKEDVKAEKKVDSKAAAKVIKKNAAAAKKQAHMQALWNAAQDHDGSSLFPPTVVVPKGVPLEGKYIGYDAAKQVLRALPLTQAALPFMAAELLFMIAALPCMEEDCVPCVVSGRVRCAAHARDVHEASMRPAAACCVSPLTRAPA